VVDSLSTLWLAGMDERFSKARSWVAAFDFAAPKGCNLFESNIRVLGGLLSAGALSGDAMFFDKAESVAKVMMPSFNTPSGIPCNAFPVDSPNCASANLAEVGTLVLEWTYLSQVTGNDVYQRMAERTMRSIMTGRNMSGACLPGIYTTHVSVADGSASSQCWGSMGGGADSFYEYLLKLWLLVKQDSSFAPYKAAWDKSMETFTTRFLRCSDRGHLYVASGDANSATNEVEHLACFLGGNLVLGDSQRYLRKAGGITESCVAMYTSTPSKLGSDGVSWRGSHDASRCAAEPKGHENADVQQRSASNLQRPETVESLLFMYRATGDARYRDEGWTIFAALNQTRIATGGFASVNNVYAGNVADAFADKQESFFIVRAPRLAEITQLTRARRLRRSSTCCCFSKRTVKCALMSTTGCTTHPAAACSRRLSADSQRPAPGSTRRRTRCQCSSRSFRQASGTCARAIQTAHDGNC